MMVLRMLVCIYVRMGIYTGLSGCLVEQGGGEAI